MSRHVKGQKCNPEPEKKKNRLERKKLPNYGDNGLADKTLKQLL